MAVEMHAGFSFSIREYVSRMRAVNVVESCPFDRTMCEESMLPPMTVRRFRWWADGLTSDSSSNKKKNAREAKVKKPSRTKAKAPKKKSILEIFAVAAPAVEEEKTTTTTKNKKKPNKSKATVAWSKLKKTKNKVIQKREKKKDTCAAFKHQLDKGEELGDAKEDGHDGNGISKGKPGLQNLTRNVDAERGIVNKDSKQFSPQMYKKSILQEAVRMNHRGKQKADRNIGSVEKDNGPSKARKIARRAKCQSLKEFSCLDMGRRYEDGCVGMESDIVETVRNKGLQQTEEIPLPSQTTLEGVSRNLLNSGGLRQVDHDGNAGEGDPLPSRCSQNVEVLMNSSGTKAGILRENHPEGHIHQKLTMYGQKENVLGLPLNSNGELTTLDSCPRWDLNQMMKSSASAAASISLSPPNTKTFQAQGCLEESTMGFAPSRLDVTDSQHHCPPFHEVSPLYKDYNMFEKCSGNERNMSKLRLMGKEFVVGEALQDFETGHRWKDKQQVVDELHLNETSSRCFMMPDQNDLCMHSFPHFECATPSTHQSNDFKARESCAVEKTFMPSSYNYVQDPYPVEYGYQFHQGSCPTMRPTDFQHKNMQSLHHAPTPTIRFPFMLPDFDGIPAMSNLQAGHAVGRYHHPFVTQGANRCTYPIMYPEPETYCSFVPALVPPTLLAHPSSSAWYPVSSVRKCHGNQKMIIPRIMSERELSLAHNTERVFFPAPKKSRILIRDGHRDDMRARRVHPWSGPVKLTAGANHVLRASQGIDQNNSSPTDAYNYIPSVAAAAHKASVT